MTRRTSRAALLLPAAGVAAVAGLAVTAGYFYFESSAERPPGTVPVAGLQGPVRVYSDTFGIPHLFAAGSLDMLRAQGYLHAYDRLWQMDLLRRIARGRLAEVFGEQALPTDRFMRTLGLWQAAERSLAMLSEEERARLDTYAEGVNGRIGRRELPLPPEFVILQARPERWDAQSSLAVGMVMNLDLSHWRNDLGRFWASRHLPAEKLPYLTPEYPEWGPTILDPPPTPPEPGDETRRAEPIGSARAVPGPGASGDRTAGRPRPAGPGRAWDPLSFLEAYSTRVASNAWALAGGRTASGAPILANDMHLGLRAPAIWYLAALHADSAEVHVAGFTLPGVPGVVVGYNRDLAWGFTNGMVDDMDFVIEELRPDGTYRDGAVWLELVVRPETIQVRGRSTPEIWEVRETVRGPLLSDALPDLGADLSAVWVAASPDATTVGLWEMNTARSVVEFDRAIRSFSQPHQNVVFASRTGRIGYRLGGRIPVRSGWDGSIPVAVDVFGDGWAGYRPPSWHPAVFDPPKGFIVTANNLQARSLGRAISTDYAEPFRALRLTQALEARGDWSLATVYGLQHDTRSLLADRTVDRAIAAARRAGAAEVAAMLGAWDREVTVDSRAAPLFYSWLYRLRTLIAADEYSLDPSWGFFPLGALLTALEEGNANPWVDDVRTDSVESLTGLEERAMRDAVAAIDGRSWGEVHRELHAHPLGRAGWLNRLFGFDIGPYPAAGGPHTVRPDDYRRWARLDSTSWAPPWTSEYGPSERFVAELAPERATGWFLIPTGQSGNPFSSHYRDMNARWRGGELVEVPLERDEAQKRSLRRLTLVPDRRRSGEADPTEEVAESPEPR